ncbi:MAG: exodeoxyribonuclease VII small subunit [Candidatus Zixiibacteriota bacterium]
MTASIKKYKDYESALGRLEEITSLLESGEMALEESIQLYTEGLEISKFCDKKLTEVEKKIKIISEQNNKLVEKEFEPTPEDNNEG